MGARSRVNTVTTPSGTGATYVPIDRHAKKLTIQAIAIGTVTFTVDYTLDNILPPAAAGGVAAASADWTNLIGSGSSSTSFRGDLQAYALRVNITAGTGSVRLKVAQ
jgi:hypothetical protein